MNTPTPIQELERCANFDALTTNAQDRLRSIRKAVTIIRESNMLPVAIRRMMAEDGTLEYQVTGIAKGHPYRMSITFGLVLEEGPENDPFFELIPYACKEHGLEDMVTR